MERREREGRGNRREKKRGRNKERKSGRSGGGGGEIQRKRQWRREVRSDVGSRSKSCESKG